MSRPLAISIPTAEGAGNAPRFSASGTSRTPPSASNHSRGGHGRASAGSAAQQASPLNPHTSASPAPSPGMSALSQRWTAPASATHCNPPFDKDRLADFAPLLLEIVVHLEKAVGSGPEVGMPAAGSTRTAVDAAKLANLVASFHAEIQQRSRELARLPGGNLSRKDQDRLLSELTSVLERTRAELGRIRNLPIFQQAGLVSSLPQIALGNDEEAKEEVEMVPSVVGSSYSYLNGKRSPQGATVMDLSS